MHPDKKNKGARNRKNEAGDPQSGAPTTNPEHGLVGRNHESATREQKPVETVLWRAGNLLISLLTLVAVGWYACTARSQLQVSENTLVLEQRAWILPEGVLQGPTKSDSQDLGVRIRNSGKGPAFVVHASVWGDYLPRDPDQIPRGVAWKVASQSEAVISGDSQPLYLAVTMPPDAVAKMQAGIPVYLFGKITYQDQFQRLRKTTFCYDYRLDRTGGDPWAVFEKYNSAD